MADNDNKPEVKAAPGAPPAGAKPAGAPAAQAGPDKAPAPAAAAPSQPVPAPEPVPAQDPAEVEKEKRRTDKSPALAGTLSLFVWGAGSFYNGDLRNGILFLLCYGGWGAVLMGVLNPSYPLVSMSPFAPHPVVRLVSLILIFGLGILVWLVNIGEAYTRAREIRMEHHGIYHGKDNPFLSAVLSLVVWGWGQIYSGHLSEGIFLILVMLFWFVSLLFIRHFSFVWQWGQTLGQQDATESFYVFFLVFSVLGVYLWYQSVKRAFLQAYHWKILPQILAKEKAEREEMLAERARERAAQEGQEVDEFSEAPEEGTGEAVAVPAAPVIHFWQTPAFFSIVRRVVKLAVVLVIVGVGWVYLRHLNWDNVATYMDKKARQYHEMGLVYLPVSLEGFSLNLNPDDLAARIRLADYSWQTEKYQIALEQYEQLYQLEPSNIEYRLRRAWSMYYLEFYEQATKEFLEIASLKDTSPSQTVDALHGLGESALSARNYDVARNAYYTILSFKPQNPADLTRLEQIRTMELDSMKKIRNYGKEDRPPLKFD